MTQQDLQSIKQRFKIIGADSALNRAIEVAVQVAPTDLSVLVTGESGVGKEHFPQIIHAYSARKHGPYFAVNCGAIPEGTINSELFGHEKGAFTGAVSEHKGYFENANGGTVFLDEVGELPLSSQVQLLRVLESGEFVRVGSNQVQKTNVRVVAATNMDMPRAIREGRFREDLYYRLNTVEIKVPSLRDRRDDIFMLFRKFAYDFAEKCRMPEIHLTPDAAMLLQNYYWQGNIRQLKNVAEQVSVLETSRTITADMLRPYLPDEGNRQDLVPIGQQASGDAFMNERELLYKVLFDMKRDMTEMRQQLNGLMQSASEPITAPKPAPTTMIQHRSMRDKADYEVAEVLRDEPTNIEDMTIEAIRRALERHKGNRKYAARELQISERTLYRKIKEYGL
ncbi:MAG: sigma-54 dependent transcriptional regulator [Paludibacteraceae bacterium]|nr:sigma-54 dependent transcriptional regulator [Paludibacteraceae bacterium]